MLNQISSIKINFKYIYLPILAFALLCDLLPVLGRVPYWLSIFLIFCCLIYFILQHKTLNKAYMYWVVLFCSFFLISSLWALDVKLVKFVLAVRLLPLLIVTFSVSMYIKSLEDVYDILKVFYIVALLVLVYLLLFVNISSVSERMSYDQLGDNWNTNSIGTQFVFAIYSGIMLFWRKHLPIKVLFVIASMIMIYITLLTGSRKALIMFFIPIIYFFIFNNKIKLKVKLTSLFVSFGLIYILFSVPYFYNIAGSRLMDMINIISGNATGNEDSSRFFLILFGWEWFKEHVWLGYGINNFRVLSNATEMFAGKNFYAHCNYIELLVGVGIIGTFIYYSGYIYVFFNVIKQKTELSKLIIALFLTLLFIDIAQVTYYGLMYMLFICIGFSLITISKNYINVNN